MSNPPYGYDPVDRPASYEPTEPVPYADATDPEVFETAVDPATTYPDAVGTSYDTAPTYDAAPSYDAAPTYGAYTDQPDGGSPSTTDVAKDEAAAVKDTAVDAGKNVAGTAKAEAANVVSEAGAQAKSLLGTAGSELKGQASTQQNRLAGTVKSYAEELHGLVDQTEKSGPITDLAHQAAAKGSEIAQWLEDREPADVLEEVRSFARRRPVAFLVICGAAGVLAGRLTRGAVAANTSVDSPKPARADEDLPAIAPVTTAPEFAPPASPYAQTTAYEDAPLAGGYEAAPTYGASGGAAGYVGGVTASEGTGTEAYGDQGYSDPTRPSGYGQGSI